MEKDGECAKRSGSKEGQVRKQMNIYANFMITMIDTAEFSSFQL